MKFMCGYSAEVLHFRNIDADPTFFYGEIPKEAMRSILCDPLARRDVESAVSAWCDRSGNEYFRSYALDPRRALGLRLLGDLRGRRVMDYGCGVGSLGVPAVRAGADVTFVDNCLPRIEMALLRARQSRGTFRGIACRTWRSLDESVRDLDVILVNGVLEWVPSTVGATFEQVTDIQLDFLHCLRERLKSDGRIYLAIENRFALQYVMGYPEDHTDIPYLSVMGREEANRIHRERKNKDFTTWTWGLDEFNEKLPRAGLGVLDAYALFPDYRFPQLAVSLDDEEGLREGMALEGYAQSDLRKLLTGYFYEMRMLRHVVYSYALILGKV